MISCMCAWVRTAFHAHSIKRGRKRYHVCVHGCVLMINAVHNSFEATSYL